jgi:hypothetical protein
MKDIFIKPTKRTPFVNLSDGSIQIIGRSILENSAEFYKPIFEWIKKYSTTIHTSTQIDLNFEYINTSSTKWVFNILKTLGKNREIKDMMKINWYYEVGDDDMFELGKIFKSLVKSPFTFIETEEKKE